MTTAAERVWTGGRPLKDAYGDMAWRRPGLFRRELILEAGSETLASLTWPKWYSFEAVADSADGRWVLGRRRNTLLSGCVVRDASGVERASFERSWRGTGRVRFASGAEYAWQRDGFWRPHYFWTGADGVPLIRFRSVVGFGRSYEMTVEPAARSLPELPELTFLGGYLMALRSAQRHAH